MFVLRCNTEISCSHHLPKHLGLCKNIHGHNYIIDVEIHTPEVNHNHMVVDFGELKRIIREWDHKSLNDFMENPTAECMAFNLSVRIAELLGLDTKVQKLKVKVTESKGCSVEYIS